VRNIFFATNAMVPVCGASVSDLDLAAKIFLLWKSNKKVLQCQRNSTLRSREDARPSTRIQVRK
jgi:hypothetical protein